MNNASSNDTCLRAIWRELRPDWNEWDIEERRIRCFGHVINLVAKSFLYGSDADAFETEVTTIKSQERLSTELKHWRKRGAIGKLHNIVTYIRKTPQRRDEFASLLTEENRAQDEFKALQVVANNATRWHSLFDMIERALRLRHRIDQFVYQNRTAIHGSAAKAKKDKETRTTRRLR